MYNTKNDKLSFFMICTIMYCTYKCYLWQGNYHGVLQLDIVGNNDRWQWCIRMLCKNNVNIIKCMYMYVYICVCMCVYVCVCLHTHPHTPQHTHTHTHIYCIYNLLLTVSKCRKMELIGKFILWEMIHLYKTRAIV